MTAVSPTRVLRVHCERKDYSEKLAESVQVVLGLRADVRPDPAGGATVELATNTLGASSDADVILTTVSKFLKTSDLTDLRLASLGSSTIVELFPSS